MNLLGEIKHITDICSNVGEATVIRIRPELAAQEHDYFEGLKSGRDEKYNERYQRAHDEFFARLTETKHAETQVLETVTTEHTES